MRLIDALHLDDPSKGTRMLAHNLEDVGLEVGRTRVRHLLEAMRIEEVDCMRCTTVIDATKCKIRFCYTE
jgi:hypothetical protein